MCKRIDTYLVDKGIIDSRNKAQQLIQEGQIYVNGKNDIKPSQKIREFDKVEFIGAGLKYVGRGGYKLEKAIDEFHIKLENKTCLDIGASTGGFTHCILQNGAKKVYALDVGYGQLADTLLNDNRVINMENTNIKDVELSSFIDDIDFISIDVSFISLEIVLPKAFLFVTDGEIMALIKPQFEAGKIKTKKGVISNKKIHISVIEKIYKLSLEHGFHLKNLTYSPLKGNLGNIEYLSLLSKNDKNIFNMQKLKEVVDKAFLALK